MIFEIDGRWQLVTKPTYRRRLILAFLLLMGGQNVGIIAINNYNVLLYQSLGLSNAGSLAVSAAWNTVGWIANMIGATVSDKVGRRNALGKGTICYIESILLMCFSLRFRRKCGHIHHCDWVHWKIC
jgi:MFS family permease